MWANAIYLRRASHSAGSGQRCGCSSVVERHVANVNVAGSNPVTRFKTGALRSVFLPTSFFGDSGEARRLARSHWEGLGGGVAARRSSTAERSESDAVTSDARG